MPTATESGIPLKSLGGFEGTRTLEMYAWFEAEEEGCFVVTFAVEGFGVPGMVVVVGNAEE